MSLAGLPPQLLALSAEARQLLLLRQRRLDVIALLDTLDDATLAHAPWLALYQARRALRQQSDLLRTHDLLRMALAAFQESQDMEGLAWLQIEWLVWAALTRTFAGLDLAHDALTDDEAQLCAPPSYLQASLLIGRSLCLVETDHLDAALDGYEKALDLLDREPDLRLQRIGRVETLCALASGYHANGQARDAIWAAETATGLACEDETLEDLLPWCYYALGLAYWRKGEFVLASRALDTARDQAEDWRHRELWCRTVALQGHLMRDRNDLVGAREAYRLAESWGEDRHGPTFFFIREGQLAEARWACHMLLEMAQQRQTPVLEADALLLRALLELRSGQLVAALEALNRSITTYQAHHYLANLACACFYRAGVFIGMECYAEADVDLRYALPLFAREEIFNLPWWLPELCELLLLRALQMRIEPIHVRLMIERRFLHALPALASFDTHLERPAHDGIGLELARQTQRSLLPVEPPFVAGLDIAGLCIPAEEVGGDFYGYYFNTAKGQPPSDRHLRIALGDISGKGLHAALLTSGTVVALNTAALANLPPNVLLNQVHVAIHPFIVRSRRNVTLCYVALERMGQHWQLRTANAGGIAPLLRRSDRTIEWVEASGLPLGLIVASDYRETTTTLMAGDLLLLISDGVVEAMNTEGEIFGFERFEQAIAHGPAEQGAQAIVAHLLTAVQTYAANAPQHDDITVVAVLVQ